MAAIPICAVCGHWWAAHSQDLCWPCVRAEPAGADHRSAGHHGYTTAAELVAYRVQTWTSRGEPEVQTVHARDLDDALTMAARARWGAHCVLLPVYDSVGYRLPAEPGIPEVAYDLLALVTYGRVSGYHTTEVDEASEDEAGRPLDAHLYRARRGGGE